MWRKTGLALSLLSMCLALPSAARGAANATLTTSFAITNGDCTEPAYAFQITADFTSDDDGLGNDWIAVLAYDGGYNILDNDFVSVQVPGDVVGGGMTAGIISRFDTRYFMVRAFDIGDPGGIFANDFEGQELAVEGTLLAQAFADPANSAAVCAAVPVGPNVRVEALTRFGQNGVSATSAKLLLDAQDNDIFTVLTPAAARIAVIYSVECAVLALDDTTYVDLDLEVDGVGLAPTAGARADGRLKSTEIVVPFTIWSTCPRSLARR